jgi:hypothetical protein
MMVSTELPLKLLNPTLQDLLKLILKNKLKNLISDIQKETE